MTEQEIQDAERQAFSEWYKTQWRRQLTEAERVRLAFAAGYRAALNA